MKKKFFRSIAHYLPQTLLLISLLTSNVLFPASVIAQEVENINEANTVTQEETVPTVEVDTSEDILEEGISTSIYEQESIPEIQIPPFTFENGIYTVNNVIPEEEYIYPENDNVRVKFTKVTQGGNLVIKRVELTKEQKKLLNTKDNYGWDITSSMENGTFKYTLTLPNIYDNTNVEVKYTEDGNNYESIQTNSIDNNRIVIEGLDHFTTFVTVPLPKITGTPVSIEVASCLVTIEERSLCFETIQEAIKEAKPGETITVQPGRYHGNIDINKDKITIISADGPEKTAIIGTGGEDPVVKFSSNGSTLEGFIIDNNKGERAIAPQASSGTNIKNNIIINSVRGIQGDFNGRPKDLTITDNIFDSTVSYGIAGTEEVTNLLVTGNAFKTLVEGIGLGAGVTLKEEKTIKDLLEINKFDLAGGYAIGDYRAGTLQPTKYTVNGYLLVENGDSIQKVIDVSSNGDTIQVGTGTFHGGIVINKSITLKNGSLPRIDCGGSGVGITVNAPNVTIDGFEITNCNIGIRSYGGPSNLGSLTINNSKIYKNTENGILLVNDTFETVNLNNLSIYENGGNGIGLGQITVTKNINAKSLVIEKSNYHGLFISESTIENLDVVNSVFRESQTSGYSGITIGTKKSTINNLNINKTTFNDNNGAGISIIQAAHQLQNILITNSQFIKNKESGIVFGGEASSKTVNITDSVFQSNKWEDIDLTGGWWGGFSVTTSADISKNNFLSQTGYKIYIGSSGLINKVKISNNNFYGTGVAVYNENSTTTPDLDSNWWNTFNDPSGRIIGNKQYTYWLCQPYQTTWISQNGVCKLNAPQNLGWNVSSLANNPGETPVKLSCGSFTNDNTPSHVWTSVLGNNIKYQRQAKAPSGGWWTDPNVYTNTYTPFTYFGQSGQGNGWEGEWNSRVRAFYDENGNGVYDNGEITSDWSDECTITYDKTAPSKPSNLSYTVNGQSLSCGSYTNIYNVRANWSASSDNLSEIDHYEYQSFNPPNGWIWPNNNYGENVSTTYRKGAFTVGQGTYGFRVRAVDKAGNKSDWSSTDFNTSCKITYDKTAPSAPNLKSPVNNSVVNGSVLTNEWEPVSDAVKYIYESYNDEGATSLRFRDTYTTTSKTAYNVQDTTFWWRVKSVDAAGNESDWSELWKVTVDNIAPVVELLSPSDNYYTKETAVIQTWKSDATDISYYEYRSCPNDPTSVECTTPIYFQSGITTTSRTVHNNNISFWWQVRAVDKAGNIGEWSTPRKITIDNIAPSAPTIIYPLEGSYFKSTPILNDWSDVTDLSGIAYYRIEYQYDDGHTFSGGPYRTTTISERNHVPGIWEEGGVKFRVRAIDNAGNEGEWSEWRHYYYISSKPVVSLISPYDNFITNQSFTQNWNVDTFHANHIDHYEYRSCQNNPTTDGTCNVLFEDKTLTSNSRTVEKQDDKIFWWQVRAIDKAGNIGEWSAARKVTLDSTAPTTTLSSDPSNTFVNQPVLISGQSTDANGVDSVNIFYRVTGTTNWTHITTLNSTSNDYPYNWEYKWAPESDGTYDIKVSATDIVGNIEESAYIYALTYDSTPPTITVFNIVSNILNISASDLLSGTDKIEVKINDGEWITYTTNMDLNTLLNNTPGTYTIYARVTDKAGNATESSTTYTIPQPTPATTTPEGQVLGATTTKTTTKKTTTTALTTTQDTETTPEEIVDTSIEEKSVLGATCENKKKVSGNVYLDKNKDNEMNENEEGIKDITLTIQYTDEEGNIKTEEEVKTGEYGYWETQLCSGKYNIVVKKDTLPKNIEVPEVLSLTVSDNEKETIFDIQALDTRNFWQKYWYLIVGGLAIIVIGYTSIKSRKKEEI